ncbi:MAG: CDP-alcohol phosphatidyltransferase family protein [Candidatus Omnitrophica bacterium]|nr:CDP-alcohol phosphatidyltransferase family protein [Candidatus Omnitrophota bacterium]
MAAAPDRETELNLANRLSLLRIILVPVFVLSLVYYSPEKNHLRFLSVGIFILACATDALDGYLARRLGEQTVLGSYIDPIADKLLLVSGFLSLSFMGHLPAAIRIPAWVTVAVISRDLLIIIGAIIIFITTGRLKAEPLFVGKATTVLQMATLFLSLLAAPGGILFLFFIATVTLTILSGVLYVQMGGRLLQTD